MPSINTNHRVIPTQVFQKRDILGASASQHMGIITVNRANIRQITATNREPDILANHKDVFNQEVGHFPGEHKPQWMSHSLHVRVALHVPQADKTVDQTLLS